MKVITPTNIFHIIQLNIPPYPSIPASINNIQTIFATIKTIANFFIIPPPHKLIFCYCSQVGIFGTENTV